MEFKKAIVREIASSYKGCISSHDELQILNIEKARKQHFQYYKTLEELGLEVIILAFYLLKF